MPHIFITGGATGIGRAAVLKFEALGYFVTFMDINEQKASELAGPSHPKICYARGNLKCKEDIARALKMGCEKFGTYTAIFCNGGIHKRNNVFNITDEELEDHIDINIKGTVNTLRLGVPYLKEQGGAIVINASDQVFVGHANSLSYGLTKGAIGQIVKGLAIDLAPFKIRVNAVCPGTVKTPLVDKLFSKLTNDNQEEIKKLWAEENAQFLRGSAGTPEEVANLVAFLISDEAAFITGAQYLIDGGYSCH